MIKDESKEDEFKIIEEYLKEILPPEFEFKLAFYWEVPWVEICFSGKKLWHYEGYEDLDDRGTGWWLWVNRDDSITGMITIEGPHENHETSTFHLGDPNLKDLISKKISRCPQKYPEA